MQECEYFHGFSSEERQRMIQQAEYWSHSLPPPGYRAGRVIVFSRSLASKRA